MPEPFNECVSLNNKSLLSLKNDAVNDKNNKNQALDLKAELPDSLSLSETKIGLEQLMSAFYGDRITIPTALDMLGKYDSVILKKNMVYASLSESERDLLYICIRLFRELAEEIQASYQ